VILAMLLIEVATDKPMTAKPIEWNLSNPLQA
jgi:hypothetical protein